MGFRGIPRPMGIGEIMFCKALVVTGWIAFKEARDNRKAKRLAEEDAELARVLNEEWNRGCADLPRILTYTGPELGGPIRAVK